MRIRVTRIGFPQFGEKKNIKYGLLVYPELDKPYPHDGQGIIVQARNAKELRRLWDELIGKIQECWDEEEEYKEVNIHSVLNKIEPIKDGYI